MNIFKRKSRQKSEINWQSLFLAGDTTTKVRAGDYSSMINSYDGWVYACVSCIARNVARCRMHLYAKTGIEQKYRELFEHPFWDLMKNPNSQMNSYELTETTQIHLDLTGNAYWYVNINRLGKPVELYVLPPNKMSIQGTMSRITGYTYYSYNGSLEFTPDEILHFKYSNPAGGFYGLSPLQAMIYTVSEDELLHKFGFNILKNQAIPGNIFVAEEFVDTDMLKAAKEEIKQEYEGVQKAGKTMILKGLKPTRLGLSPVEMAFLESKKFTMEEIMAFYGVPGTKLGRGGTVQGGTPRATAEALDASFQQETVYPRLMRIEYTMNGGLLPRWDDRLVVEYENPVPADREFELKQWETWLKNYVKSVNEYREWMGDKPAKWGNVPLVPFNLTPLAGTSSGDDGKRFYGRVKEKVKVTKLEFEKFKSAKWTRWVKSEEEIENQYVADLKKFFAEQGKIVRANIDRFYNPKQQKKNLVEHIFPPMADEAEKLMNVSKPNITNAVAAGIEIAAEFFGNGKNIMPTRKSLEDSLNAIGMTMTTFENYISSVLLKWRDLFGFTILETIENLIGETLGQAIAEGWNISRLQSEIESIYDGYDGMNPIRSLRIARTEVSRVMNESELMAYNSLGYTEKTWAAALDENTCEECMAMDGEVVAINEPFSCGVFAPPLHPSDRCNILAGNWSEENP